MQTLSCTHARTYCYVDHYIIHGELESVRLKAGMSKLSHILRQMDRYGVATISRLLKMIGLFCKRAL